jgi:hypothetical protein
MNLQWINILTRRPSSTKTTYVNTSTPLETWLAKFSTNLLELLTDDETIFNNLKLKEYEYT